MKLIHGIFLITIFALLGTLHVLQSVEYFPSRKPIIQETTPAVAVAPQQEKVIAYEDCNYQGRSIEFGVGTYPYSYLNEQGFNDKISSFKIPQGLKVSAFEHNINAGRQWDFYSDKPCLINEGANDTISAIIVSQEQPQQLPQKYNAREAQSHLDWIRSQFEQAVMCNAKKENKNPETALAQIKGKLDEILNGMRNYFINCVKYSDNEKMGILFPLISVELGFKCRVEQNPDNAKYVDGWKSIFEDALKYLENYRRERCGAN